MFLEVLENIDRLIREKEEREGRAKPKTSVPIIPLVEDWFTSQCQGKIAVIKKERKKEIVSIPWSYCALPSIR